MSEFFPEQTEDDTDEGWGEYEEDSRDDEYLEEVPPHHGE